MEVKSTQKKVCDFTYIDEGMFISLYPNTPEAEKVWAYMAEEIAIKRDHELSGVKIIAFEFPKIAHQLRRSGYSLNKENFAVMKTEEVNELLAKLLEEENAA